MVFLIQRVDFDCYDPREPHRRTILGYCPTRDEADSYATDLTATVEGMYWGYDRAPYPKFEVVQVPELMSKVEFK